MNKYMVFLHIEVEAQDKEEAEAVASKVVPHSFIDEVVSND